MASFRSALVRGAQQIEMDVRRTADGTWIVFHNKTRRRLDPIPAMSHVFAWCRRQHLPVYLDIKESSHEKELLILLQQSGWLGQTTLLAGSAPTLRRWRQLLPHHPLFWVTGYHESITTRRLSTARRVKLNGFVSYRRQISSESVEKVHRAGMKLLVWTARSAREIQRLSRLGVDGIMSEVWPPPRLI